MSEISYPVEIKVNLAPSVADALTALGLDRGSERQIWFLEDLTPGLEPALPLLAAGVVLRLRSGETEESTIKLRPCRRTQLTPEWANRVNTENNFKYRVEADWAGQRRTLAASAVMELGRGLIDAVTLEGADPDILFDGQQQRFLRACGDLRVAFAGLTPLGPVMATKWKSVAVGGLEANVERWTVGTLDFLEVSIRTESRAEQQQLHLEAAIRARGLTIDESPESKTGRVLAELAGAA